MNMKVLVAYATFAGATAGVDRARLPLSRPSGNQTPAAFVSSAD